MSKAGIQVRHNDEEQRFEVLLGDTIALIEYTRMDDRIIFTHTEVPEANSGQGIAALMAHTALEFARENNLTVSSLCAYIDAYIQRHPEYKFLLGA